MALNPVSGAVETLKVLTTPTAPRQDVAAGLRRLAGEGLDLATVDRFVHGTTVGVNTTIQRCGAGVALFTTAGFTIHWSSTRLRMPSSYSLFCERPAPLVAREHVFGITERVNANGGTLRAPEEADVARAVAAAHATGCEAVVVSFLHAWRDGQHERAIAAMLSRFEPALTVFTGAEVWPTIREYERTSTAILNAYVHAASLVAVA